MKTWIVRANCEYSIDIEADTADEAMSAANEIDMRDWIQAWSPTEAEEV